MTRIDALNALWPVGLGWELVPKTQLPVTLWQVLYLKAIPISFILAKLAKPKFLNKDEHLTFSPTNS